MYSFSTKKLQKCIDTCVKTYGTNPLYSHSTPSFTWKTGSTTILVKPDCITDDKIYTQNQNDKWSLTYIG